MQWKQPHRRHESKRIGVGFFAMTNINSGQIIARLQVAMQQPKITRIGTKQNSYRK